jgi:ABC-type bacteriocin/lantibiotic exporter with double-glycine peptidase domain
MTTAKLVEYQITQQLLRRQEEGRSTLRDRIVERTIRTAAIVVGMVLLGSYSQELLWVVLAAGGVFAMGVEK